MSSEQEQVFQQAIVEAPDDDTPRRVYADWLEEHGDADRAELIRAQCRLARLPEDDDAYSDLQARELRLLSRHGMTWREGFRAWVEFRRGMLEVWGYADPGAFGGTGRELFARHPICEVSVRRTEGGTRWGDVAAESPHLARVETLRILSTDDEAPFPDLLTLLSSPHLTGLTELDLSGSQHGDAGLFELLGAAGRRPAAGRSRRQRVPSSRAGAGLLSSLRRLRRLSLRGVRLTDRGLRLLLDSQLADTLTHLDLSAGHQDGPRLSADGIRALVESRLWPRLEELNLGGLYAHNDPEPARLLFEALPRSGLRALGLGAYAWGPDVTAAALVEAMASAPSWGRLEALGLGWNLFRREDVRALLRCPQLAGLRRLEIGGYMPGAAAAALAGCPFLAGLTALSLGGSHLDDDGMAAVAASPHLRRLVHLHVEGCPVGDAGVAAFVSSPNAGRLRILEVPGVGDDALKALARSPHLGRLTVVTFGGWVGPARFTPTTDAGALAVAHSAHLPNLVVLNRHWPREAVAGLRALIRCGRLAYAGWTTYDVDPELTPVHQQAAALPHRFTAPGSLFSLSSWMAGARV